jgi:MSHA biogenesis protein MshP
LLVVLAGLGAAMVTLFATQQASASLDEQGARAYQAARAGAEWGLYQQLRLGNCVAATPVAMPAGTTLSAFTVSVLCEKRDLNGQLARYVITATACNQPGPDGCPNSAPTSPDYVARKVEVEL